MKAKLVKESSVFKGPSPQEIDDFFQDNSVLLSIEKVLGRPIEKTPDKMSYPKDIMDSQYNGFLQEIIDEFKQKTGDTMKLIREYNIGDAYIVQVNNSNFKQPENMYDYQVFLNLNPEDSAEYDGDLSGAGFAIAEDDGYEIEYGMTLDEFIEKYEAYKRNGLFESFQYDPTEYSEEIIEILSEMTPSSKIDFIEDFYQKPVDRAYAIENPEEIDAIITKGLSAGKFDISDVIMFAEYTDGGGDDEEGGVYAHVPNDPKYL
jgi:hypothetical protein